MQIGRPKESQSGHNVVAGRGVLLCVIGRRENRYAVEYVEHYRKLGFDHIVVCDNNREGEEYFEDVLQPYVDEGFVEIINYRDEPGFQCAAYSAVYRKYGRQYRWLAFFDFDEYLTIPSGNDVHSLMKSYEGFDCVFFNWMNYGDNGLIRNDGRLLAERFTEPLPEQHVQYDDHWENEHVKCVVRGGIEHLNFYLCPHLPYSPKLRCCDSTGEECSQRPFQKTDFSVAYLKHYITKTVEEWANVKWQKGAGTHLNMEEFRSRYAGRFFKYNEWTQEKEDIYRQLTGMSCFKSAKNRRVVIVNFNTQRLTDCAIRSLNKHTPGCKIAVFDNSDKEPYVNTFDNVEVVDNTKGQFINFKAFLEEYPDRMTEDRGNGSNFGSAKHCKTVDVCTDLYPEGFLLMDSDILIKKDVSRLFDASCVWTGMIGSVPSIWNITVPRVRPFLCYVNVPMMRKHGVRYFNGDKMYALTDRIPDRAYDTGAWFYEDCNNHGLQGNDINICDYMIHFDHGSWLQRDPDEWLDVHKDLWE